LQATLTALSSETMSSFIMYVTFDCANPKRIGAFWSEVTGYSAVMEEDDFVALAAPDQRGVRGILFWKVPEPKASKNRMHVDLATKIPEEEIERLVALGAQMVEYREVNGRGWTVMLDPEGNEFCIG
jgi:predicted enzyme related to lactoylglutathione lyase